MSKFVILSTITLLEGRLYQALCWSQAAECQRTGGARLTEYFLTACRAQCCNLAVKILLLCRGACVADIHASQRTKTPRLLALIFEPLQSSGFIGFWCVVQMLFPCSQLRVFSLQLNHPAPPHLATERHNLMSGQFLLIPFLERYGLPSFQMM